MNIAVVNLDSAMAQSVQGRELMQQLTTFQRETQDRIRSFSDDLQQLRRQITQGAATLSTEQLRSLQQDFESKRIKLQEFQQDKQAEGEQMHHAGLEVIQRKLGPVLEALRNESEYDLIIDAKSVLVMADWVDITKSAAMGLSQAG